MEQFVAFVNRTSFLPPILVFIYTLLIFRTLAYELKPFGWFTILSGIIEGLSRTLSSFQINNMPLLHIYVAGGFVCLALFYGRIFKGFLNPNLIKSIIGLFLFATLINVLFFQSFFSFNSNLLTAESVLIIIFSLSTYILLLNEIVKKSRMDLLKSLNWINSGLFLYFTSSLIIFYFGDIITRSISLQTQITWSMHAVFSSLMYVCFFVGLWNRPRK